MEKTKSYKASYFSADVIKKVFNENIESPTRNSYRLRKEEESWEFDTENEFFSEYRKPHLSSTIRKSDKEKSISLTYNKNAETEIIVQANNRDEIESVFETFESEFENSKYEIDSENNGPIIFIGHGGNPQWRDLKDHLSDQHGYKIEAYETGARAGHSIRDILDEMSTKSSFAILVMTGEDEDKDGNKKARPNVIHEIGLFQGRLGFSRAIVLLEEETEEFSNLYGIQQLRFSKGKIKETFGDVLATLRREFN